MKTSTMTLMTAAAMNGDIVIDSLVWFPRDHFDRGEAAQHRKKLIVQPRGYGDDTPEPIKCYATTDTHIGLPIYYGLREHRKTSVREHIDGTTAGDSITITKTPEARNEEQRRVWTAMTFYFKRSAGNIAGIVEAPTGFGKTVTACRLIAEKKRAAAIIVTTKTLAKQWHDEVKKHLGISAAIVGGNSVGDKMNAPVVIVLVHQLCMKREHSAAFYDRFGVVVWDEVHRMGAREFSESLTKFKARTRLGLSATPDRKDNCERVFLSYFGKPFVVATQQTMPCDVWVIPFQVPPSTARFHRASNGNTAQLLTQVAKCDRRNEMIAAHTKKLYNKGRTILILSDRIEQLGVLKNLLIEEHGIEEEDIGTIAGDIYDVRSGTRRKLSEAEIDFAKHRAQIILATYGMAKEGLDIPRLDAGIDATPRADGTQAIGRIRRACDDKKRPVWFTIHDTNINIFSKYFHARVREYERAGATLKNHG